MRKVWRATIAACGALALAGMGLAVNPAFAAKGKASQAKAGKLRATIKYTRYGVPHVIAKDIRGLTFGFGYAHAKDNICELADTYVTVGAERSRYFGPDGEWTFEGNGGTYNNLDSDFFYQQINDSGVIEDLLDKRPPRGPGKGIKRGVRGYVSGYNHYLAEVGRKGISDPGCRGEKWVKPIKVIDAYRRFYQLASLASQGVVVDGIVNAAPALGAEAEGQRARFEAWMANPASEAGALARLQPPIGSNAYGIGSAASSNGKGLLYANPHFPWDGAERLYQSHLRIPGKLDVQGASLLGVPLVLIGWTKGLAWSHTVATAWRFVPYQLTLAPGDPYSYVIDGQTRPMERRHVTVEVKGPNGVEERTNTIYYTEFGPIFDSLVGIPLPWTPTTAFAMHDVNEQNFRYLNHFFANNKAQTVKQYDRIQARYQGIPWVNSLAADRKGNAYYTMGGAIPYITDEKASGCAVPVAGLATLELLGLPIMDGTRTSCLPDSSPDAAAPGIFPHSEIPTLIRRDYVENGNDSHWLTNPRERLTGFDRIIGIEDAERTYRTRIGLIQAEERIAGTDGLKGKGFNLNRLEQVSLGNRQYLGELWRDDLVGLCETAPVMVGNSGPVDVSAACEALAGWDLRDDLGSGGALLFRRFAVNLLSNFTGVPTGLQGAWLVGSESLWTTPYSNSDPVNTPSGLNVLNPLVQAALADAVTDLAGIGAAPDDPLRTWQYDIRGDKRIPIHGGPGGVGVFNAINAAWDSDEGYSDIPHGSSFIAAVQFKGGKCPVKADTFVTYSQSQDETSAHVNDFTKAFSKKRWNRAAVCPGQINRDPKLKVVKVKSR